MHYPNLPPIRHFKPLRLYMHYLQSVLWFRRISILSLPFNYLIIVALKYMYLLTIGIYGDSESLDNNRGLCYNYDTFFFFLKIHLFILESERVCVLGGRSRGRGRKSLMWSPCWTWSPRQGSIPRPCDHDLCWNWVRCPTVHATQMPLIRNL